MLLKPGAVRGINGSMDTAALIDRIKKQRFFSDQLQHAEALERRPASFAEVAGGLHESVKRSLEADGIEQLYAHQATAIDLVHAGKNVVIVTGTASGKTLCYNVPVLEAYLEEPLTTALFLYPTKALTQDQLRGIARFHDPDTGAAFLAGTYDGDTPQNLRRKLRDAGNFVLTNPDMLHAGILPNHARWSRFFSHLRFVIIDEVHAYRGVFGSHLANVIRRLRRICAHYGSAPQFICSSATIANPREHAQRIAGCEMELVTNDGAPRGPKHFILWNPPKIETAAKGQDGDWRSGGDRRSPLWEATHLMATLVREGIQTIAFTRTRLASELIFKNCRDLLRPESRRLADSIRAYRGGYLPEERRAIERQLVSREILGVASTNALELGIDIGSLEACIIVGYPGTIASLWQQAGRAGRGQDAALVILVGQNSPIDQFLMSHCRYLFDQSPEQAIVDPDNPHIAIDHIRCGAHELPLTDDEKALFGEYSEVVLDLLEEDQALKRIDGRWFWAQSGYPAGDVNLRNIAGAVYTIQDESDGKRVIGTMDEMSAFSQLHTHAVYIHAGETYFVNQLDIEQKIAFVEKQELDYYTQAVQTSRIRVDEPEALDETLSQGQLNAALLGFGDVTVTTNIPLFRKIRFHSRDSLGFEKLELPPQALETVAMWLAPSDEAVELLRSNGLIVGEGLIGIANVMAETAQLFVMCDAQDIGTVVDAACLGRDALFIHDRYPGGMGYARRCLESAREILQTVQTVVRECSCEDGCPSCVGSAVPAFAATDLDSSVRGRIPNRRAAMLLVNAMLGE
jgi:DEAD/DEAH box helicase domain-containing protein